MGGFYAHVSLDGRLFGEWSGRAWKTWGRAARRWSYGPAVDCQRQRLDLQVGIHVQGLFVVVSVRAG